MDETTPKQANDELEAQVDANHRDAFARLFAQHDRWLYSYLVTLLGSPSQAEEVFQEVCVVLWRELETFELGTDFVKWVAVIAHNQVRKHRRNNKKAGFHLNEETFEYMAKVAVNRADLFDYRRDALRTCLDKLSPEDRQLVNQCYNDSSSSFKTVASRLGRPENTVYKALNRIRRALHQCIDRKLSSGGPPMKLRGEDQTSLCSPCWAICAMATYLERATANGSRSQLLRRRRCTDELYIDYHGSMHAMLARRVR